jgi:hypothetical protein
LCLRNVVVQTSSLRHSKQEACTTIDSFPARQPACAKKTVAGYTETGHRQGRKGESMKHVKKLSCERCPVVALACPTFCGCFDVLVNEGFAAFQDCMGAWKNCKTLT